MTKRNYTIAFILFLIPMMASAQSIGFGGTITQSIDLLQTPVQNSERVFSINGNAFTAYPSLYIGINDNMSMAIEAGAGFAFMSKNNSRGEVDRDLLYTFPILARLNFGSAANTGNDCTLWGWYLGAGRQWRSAIDIHGTSTTEFVTYFAEIGGTINATAPADIGAFARFGFGANSTRGIQIGLTFSYNHKPNGCN